MPPQKSKIITLTIPFGIILKVIHLGKKEGRTVFRLESRKMSLLRVHDFLIWWAERKWPQRQWHIRSWDLVRGNVVLLEEVCHCRGKI